MEKNIEWQSLCKQCRDTQMQAMISLMEFKDSVDDYLQNSGNKPSYQRYDLLKMYIEYESSARKRLLEFVMANDLVNLND